MPSETDVQRLLDLEAIKQLKARYFRLLDHQDWSGFRELFVDDAHFELEGFDPIDGADAFVAFTRAQLQGARTVHHGHTPELWFDADADDEARGRWVLADYVEWPADPATRARRGIKGFGRYEETYRRVGGDWRIASWSLRYDRVDALPHEPLPDPTFGGAEG